MKTVKTVKINRVRTDDRDPCCLCRVTWCGLEMSRFFCIRVFAVRQCRAWVRAREEAGRKGLRLMGCSRSLGLFSFASI